MVPLQAMSGALEQDREQGLVQDDCLAKELVASC